MEAALNDIATLEKLANDLMELGPMNVSWTTIDREAPKYDIIGNREMQGFYSLDHATSVFTRRLAGMRCALTLNGDALLNPQERAERDGIVMTFLDRIRSTYIDGIRQ